MSDLLDYIEMAMKSPTKALNNFEAFDDKLTSDDTNLTPAFC